MRCAACGGVAHPATGCQYGPKTLICGPCTRRAWEWIKKHTKETKRVGPKGSKCRVSFYEAAGRKVK